MEQRIQEVVHNRVVGNPTQTTELIVKVLVLLEQGRPLRGIGDSGNANLGEVTDDGLHDLLVATILVVGKGHVNATIAVSASGSNLVQVLVSLVDVVGAELPCALLVAIDARRNNAVGGGTGTLEDSLADGLTVDGQGDTPAQVGVVERLGRVVAGQVVGGRLGAEQHALAVTHGVAVLGHAAILLGGVDLSNGNVADIEVTGLELLVSGLHVLDDLEVDAIDLGLVAIVIVELLEVDLLTILPLAVHHERAVTDRCKIEALDIGLGALGNRGQSRVRGDEGEVGVSGRQLDDEGLIVGASNTAELGSVTGKQVVIALDHGKVIGDLGRAVLGSDGRLGVDQTLPTELEGLGGNVVTVVELGLLDLEGELGGVVVGLKGLASQRNDLALLGVIRGQSVKELVLDLSALVLLDIVGVDADRVVDVEVQRRTGLRTGSVAALLAACGKKSHGARSEGAANKGATTHNGLVEHRISHAILLMR